jgi:hypothetical protein
MVLWGKRKDFTWMLAESDPGISRLLNQSRRCTPINSTEYGRDETGVQEVEAKNFTAMETGPDYAASGIAESPLFRVGQTIPSFPTSNSLFGEQQFPSHRKHSLPSHLGNISASF